ncbi:hypothetical protein TURU_058040 [Turdus rufiventris]|nr:hypothetical protein TURU_058040 [Turdus rufiventris]
MCWRERNQKMSLWLQVIMDIQQETIKFLLSHPIKLFCIESPELPLLAGYQISIDGHGKLYYSQDVK